MGFFTAADMADMRKTSTGAMDTPCTIRRFTTDSFAPVAPGYTVQSTTTCLVFPATGTVSYEGLPSILALQGWTLTLPWNADVRVGDRIVTAQATYFVQRVEQPSSYNINSTAHCYQLFDAAGKVVYIPYNHNVSVLRGSYNEVTRQTSAPAVVSGLNAVPVYITDTVALLQMPAGAVAPSFDPHMMWDPSWDIRDGDVISGYNPTSSVNPAILTVQHSGDPGDVPRRVCVLVAQEPAGYSLR